MKVANRQFAFQNRAMVPSEYQPPIDPYRLGNRVPDRRGEIALDQVFEAQEIVSGAGLPVAGPGLDGPGRDLAVGGDLRPADIGGELVQMAEFPQFGPEHAVVLRKAARIVSLHIDDMAVKNAHLTHDPRPDGRTISGRMTRQELFRPLAGVMGSGFS